MSVADDSQLWSRWIYLRILGVLYAFSFFSLWSQIVGLIGPDGIFPAQEILSSAAHRAPGLRRFFAAPTLLWLSAEPWVLTGICYAGFAGAIAVIVNRLPRLGLILCWTCFLSFVTVAPHFAWYESDELLLEGTVLAILVAPSGLRPGLGAHRPPSRAIVFLYRWLLFRLMLETGMSKIFSGDPTWRSLTAMDFFFETSPFPTWIGWFAHKLPHAVHRVMTGYVLFAEIGCSFLLFLGKRATLFALGAWILMQTSILLTGNFNTFNYHSIALAVFLVNDAVLLRAIPARLRALPSLAIPATPALDSTRRRPWTTYGATAAQCFLFVITLLVTLEFFRVPVRSFPPPLPALLESARPFQSTNYYILYPKIPLQRRIVVFEGSNDGGKTWRPYEYRYQTQRLDVRPPFLAPLSPRFDRESSRSAPRLPHRDVRFFSRTAQRLLEAEPSVVALFGRNPFPASRPDMVRTLFYRYQFSDRQALATTGNWWTRELLGEFSSVIIRDRSTDEIPYVGPKEHR